MFEFMSDAEFRHHVAVVAHTMAYRKYQRDHPAEGRAAAWAYAVAHWREFEDRAVAFLEVQAFRFDDRHDYRVN